MHHFQIRSLHIIVGDTLSHNFGCLHERLKSLLSVWWHKTLRHWLGVLLWHLNVSRADVSSVAFLGLLMLRNLFEGKDLRASIWTLKP